MSTNPPRVSLYCVAKQAGRYFIRLDNEAVWLDGKEPKTFAAWQITRDAEEVAPLSARQAAVVAKHPQADALLLAEFFKRANDVATPLYPIRDQPRKSIALVVADTTLAGHVVMHGAKMARMVDGGVWRPIGELGDGLVMVLATDLDDTQLSHYSYMDTMSILREQTKPAQAAVKPGDCIRWGDVPPGTYWKDDDGDEWLRWLKPDADGDDCTQLEPGNECGPWLQPDGSDAPDSDAMGVVVAAGLSQELCTTIADEAWQPTRWNLAIGYYVPVADLPTCTIFHGPDGWGVKASNGAITSNCESTVSSESSYGHVELLNCGPSEMQKMVSTRDPHSMLFSLARDRWASGSWVDAGRVWLTTSLVENIICEMPPEMRESIADTVVGAVHELWRGRLSPRLAGVGVILDYVDETWFHYIGESWCGYSCAEEALVAFMTYSFDTGEWRRLIAPGQLVFSNDTEIFIDDDLEEEWRETELVNNVIANLHEGLSLKTLPRRYVTRRATLVEARRDRTCDHALGNRMVEIDEVECDVLLISGVGLPELEQQILVEALDVLRAVPTLRTHKKLIVQYA